MKHLEKKVRINDRIQVPEVRLIDPEGKNLGLVKTIEALEKAKELGFDLIEIAPTAKPPVAKIMEKSPQSEVRVIRVGIGTSEHDLEMKAKKASGFLEKGDRIKIEMFLRGRAKYLDRNFLNERLNRILSFVTVEHKIVEGPKRGPRGPFILIERVK